jgi:alanine racemase
MNKRAKESLNKVDPHVLAASVINLDNLAKNYAKIKKDINRNVQIASVVKANAYGFGAVQVSKRLYKEGCRLFFVATISEGIEIRKNLKSDAKIFILSGLLANTEELLFSNELIPVLNGIEQADLWINYAKKINKRLNAVVHIDTGMSRNGFSSEDIMACYDKITENLTVLFAMSHLACADVLGHEMNERQLIRFKNILRALGNPRGSLSATNGIFLGADYCFDIVRPGKSLYGFSIREDKVGSMLPVMDIFSRIVQVNYLKSGETIGYGATFVADHDMRTVTIGMGYADGFMRKFSGFGQGFLDSNEMRTVGRISMDYMVFDATDVKEHSLKIGDWVALTRTPDYTLEKWALELGTLPHEIACRFGSRIEKIYIGDE